MEGIPEWFTASKPAAKRSSASTAAAGQRTPRPAYTPVEGVPERTSYTPFATRLPQGTADAAVLSQARQAGGAWERAGSGEEVGATLRTPGAEEGAGAALQGMDASAEAANSSDEDYGAPDLGGYWEGPEGYGGEEGGGSRGHTPDPLPSEEGGLGQVGTPRAAPTPALAAKKRRAAARHSPGHRLRNELGKRKSLLAAPGIGRHEVAPGIRRTSRAPGKPLMWWLNESKEYSRSAHKTMPTIRNIVHHDPNTPWQTVTDPFPAARKRAGASAAAKLEARMEAALAAEQGGEGDAPVAATGEAAAAPPARRERGKKATAAAKR